MFWSDWSDRRPRIMRAALDGTSKFQLVTELIDTPNGVALDYQNQIVYWVDGVTDTIEMVHYNGRYTYVCVYVLQMERFLIISFDAKQRIMYKVLAPSIINLYKFLEKGKLFNSLLYCQIDCIITFSSLPSLPPSLPPSPPSLPFPPSLP